MAKYYLGKYNGHEYVPVSIGLCDSSIESVVDYTSSFEDETALRNELSRLGLISGNEHLGYIIEKGTGYNLISKGKEILYQYSNAYIGNIYDTLYENRFDEKFYKFLYDEYKKRFQNVPTKPGEYRRIEALYNEVRYANSLGIDNYMAFKDKNNLDRLIRDFYISATCTYNRKSKSYKNANGENNVSQRKSVDLCLLFNEYFKDKVKQEMEDKKVNVSISKVEEPIAIEDEQDDDKEEYLTSDDFVSYGQDPDEYKRLIKDKNL